MRGAKMAVNLRKVERVLTARNRNESLNTSRMISVEGNAEQWFHGGTRIVVPPMPLIPIALSNPFPHPRRVL